MSKLVIHTQYKENYGAHDWDGEGVCPQYWKFKGGDTYVVENLTSTQIQKIVDNGIPTLSKLIEYSNDYAKEYILDWSVEEDSAVVYQEWETPIICVWKMDRWIFTKKQINNKFGHMRKEIASSFSSWIPSDEGQVSDMQTTYTMQDGSELSYQELEEFFKSGSKLATVWQEAI